MKLCRFVLRDDASSLSAYGVLEDGQIREISRRPWQSWSETSRTQPVEQVRLLAPVEPSKVVCIGRNYAAHAAELGNEVPKEPLMFLKPPSSIIGPEEPILLTPYSKQVEHEGELAIVIGKRCSHLSENEDPFQYVLGYSCLNDVTARDLQKADVQFTRGKGFDTFCPIGPHIETQLDPANVEVETRVNGAVRQSGNTSLMIYPCAFLIRWISRMMTLLPGDVIATGTPAGVGPLRPGDVVEVSVGRIGVLRNAVQASRA
jgi:2-keto-4-pentenoate hydratase/2-oxohepta-3-ene-1,7-dioic acid hydratase in catechol pathway